MITYMTMPAIFVISKKNKKDISKHTFQQVMTKDNLFVSSFITSYCMNITLNTTEEQSISRSDINLITVLTKPEKKKMLRNTN